MNKPNSTTKLIITVSVIVVIGFVIMMVSKGPDEQVKGTSDQVTVNQNGVQVATINVRGGYNPNTLTLKANQPTKLNMVTRNTYDCSASLVIPSLHVNTNLPSTGTTTSPILINLMIRGVPVSVSTTTLRLLRVLQ